MCAFSHTYVSKSKHVWKIAPRCKYTNVFGFFQTCWVKVKHLPKWTCKVFYTQVWLFSNIFAKSQTWVEKIIMFHWIFPYNFLMEIKILLISAQFCLIYFHFLKTHLSWNVYNLIYDLNFFGIFSLIRTSQLIICQTRSSWASWNGKSWVESLTFLERNWQHQSFQDYLPSVLNVICWETSFNAEDIDIKSQRPQTIKTCSDQIWLWSMWVQSNTKRQSEVAQTIDT